MTTLLHSLRAASEPSRELDGEVHAWVKGWEFSHWSKECVRHLGHEAAFFVDGKIHWYFVPHYTSNLQDALELVPVDPEVGRWSIDMEIHSAATFVCMKPPDGNYGYYVNDCPHPALALATAAIDAQMKLREDT